MDCVQIKLVTTKPLWKQMRPVSWDKREAHSFPWDKVKTFFEQPAWAPFGQW